MSKQVPKSRDICAAVKTLWDEGHEAEIGAHALTETAITLAANPDRLMTATAWAEATNTDYGIAHYLTGDYGGTR